SRLSCQQAERGSPGCRCPLKAQSDVTLAGFVAVHEAVHGPSATSRHVLSASAPGGNAVVRSLRALGRFLTQRGHDDPPFRMTLKTARLRYSKCGSCEGTCGGGTLSTRSDRRLCYCRATPRHSSAYQAQRSKGLACYGTQRMQTKSTNTSPSLSVPLL